jgi:hypothetical protein
MLRPTFNMALPRAVSEMKKKYKTPWCQAKTTIKEEPYNEVKLTAN